MKLLPRILHILETLGKNLGKILTKSAKNMYELARSCKELQEKCQVFSTKKPTIRDFSTKKHSGKTKKYQESCQEIQENPRILPRNPGKPKNKREKAGGVKIPGYNLAHRQETRTIKIQEGNQKSMKIRFISIQKSIR